MSPSINGVSKGGNSVVPKSFLPKSLYTGPAATAAMNMPLWSTQPPSTLGEPALMKAGRGADRKSTRLNSSHTVISYAVFCLKKKKKKRKMRLYKKTKMKKIIERHQST